MLIPRQYSLVIVFAAACAPARQPAQPAATAAPPNGNAEAKAARPAGTANRDLILASEIAASNLEALTADDVIRRLGPHMLRPRMDAQLGGQRLTRPIIVFINGAEAGGVDILRTIVARHVARIQFMTAVEAANRLSLSQSVGGAIVVTLK